MGNNKPLGIEYGNRMLKIISANMDDMRSQNAQHELGVRMVHMDADIVFIQETQRETEDKKNRKLPIHINGSNKEKQRAK